MQAHQFPEHLITRYRHPLCVRQHHLSIVSVPAVSSLVFWATYQSPIKQYLHGVGPIWHLMLQVSGQSLLTLLVIIAVCVESIRTALGADICCLP